MPAPSEVSKSPVGTALFRRKLSNVLNTPQGSEIKSRNWRISDRYKGGFLRKSKKNFNNEIVEEKPEEKTSLVDVLTRLELAEEEGNAYQLPLLKKMPPREPIAPAVVHEGTAEKAEKEETVEEIEDETTIMQPAEETEDYVVEVVEPKVDEISVFKAQFEESLTQNDYFGALVALLTAVFVMMYSLACDIFEELSLTVQRVVRRYDRRLNKTPR